MAKGDPIWINTDQRSMMDVQISGRTDGVRETSMHIATFASVDDINGLPLRCNNIVDPPVILSEEDLKRTLKPWGNLNQSFDSTETDLLGYAYINDYLSYGQFVTLVPLDLELDESKMVSDLSGGFMSKFVNKITSVTDRLDMTSSGFKTKINNKKYWKAVGQNLQVAALSLGINALEDNAFKNSNFYQTVLGFEKFKMDMKKANDGTEPEEAPSEIESIQRNSFDQVLKYVTNIDTSQQDVNSLPKIIFYVNGNIEKTYNTTNNMNESAIAKATVDVGMKSLVGGLSSKLGSAVESPDEVIREFAYHSKGSSNVGAFLSNTYIPSVIASSAADYSYSFNIKSSASSSSPWAILAGPFATLCKLLPFITQVNAKSHNVLPHSPMYCAAFSKGVFNMNRGAITQFSMKSEPAFQTPQGVAVEVDFSVTLVPLMSTMTMPDYDGLFNVSTEYATTAPSDDDSFMLAACMTPGSTFNMIATLAGSNTILTQASEGIITTFLRGTAVKYAGLMSNTYDYIPATLKDMRAGYNINKGGIYGKLL